MNHGAVSRSTPRATPAAPMLAATSGPNTAPTVPALATMPTPRPRNAVG